jgi:hypothetical protein
MSIKILVPSGPVVVAYLETGLVPRFPTAILALGLVIIGTLSFFAGRNLLFEPSGRGLYLASSSPQGIRSSRACTASSVSVSKPRDIAGNDLTKRRESAL